MSDRYLAGPAEAASGCEPVFSASQIFGEPRVG